MLTFVRAGMRAAWARWSIGLLLYAGLSVPGLVFATTSWAWLTSALDGSLAGRTLLKELDPNVLIDLFVHHRAGLRMLIVAGGLILVGVWVAWAWLDATAVASLTEEASASHPARRGFELFPRFLALSLMANALQAALFAGGHVVSRQLIRWTAEGAGEMQPYAIFAGTVAVVGVAVAFVASVHDHARVQVAATDSGAVRAFAWAVRFVGGWEPRAFPLSLLLLVLAGVVWGVYQTLGHLVPGGSMSGVVVSLLWGQVLLWGRCMVRLAAYGAAVRLQAVSSGV
jgi:hypothetical protein